MIEKIKNAALYIATPLVLLFGAIWWLLSANRTLKEELAEANASKTDTGLAAQEVGVDAKADNSVDTYQLARDEFLREYSKSNPLGGTPELPTSLRSSGPGNQGPEGTDSAAGPKNT